MQGGASYSWEHLDFQQGAKAHPALKKKFVRQAIIQGINRAQIREVLYIKTGLVPNPEGPAGSAEQHLQALRVRVCNAVQAVGLQPEEHHRTAEEERLHRWS